MQEIAQDIWSIDGPDVVFAGAPMNTRMTIVKLSDGGLWVHSPIAYTEDTKAALRKIGGEVTALVAPNKYHYLYLEPWRAEHPNAQVFAESSLRTKVPELVKVEVLTNTAPQLYSLDIDQVIFAGNRFFQEAVFFHKPSKTLVLTDLMINLRTDAIPWLPKLLLRFEGAVYPNGGVPRLFRLLTRDKRAAQTALAKIRGWSPERVLFCHGEPFTRSAQEILDEQFAWLS